MKDLENSKAELTSNSERLTYDIRHCEELLQERDRCINELKSWLDELALKNSDFELDSEKLRERLNEAGWREGQRDAELTQQLEENIREVRGLKEEVRSLNDEMLALREGYMELETLLTKKGAEFEILESELGDAKR
jgi:chromosome segregation ATPase